MRNRQIILLILLLPFGGCREKDCATNDPWQKANLRAFGICLPEGYAIHGIDVSHHQAYINWAKVGAMDENGIRVGFAFIRATEGITRQDHYFTHNWRESRRQGIVRGAYHFYYPSRNARAQAKSFTDRVKLAPGDLPPVLDVEVTNNRSRRDIVKGVREWCSIVSRHYGVKPIIYTNVSFYRDYLQGEVDEYGIWIAHYTHRKPVLADRNWLFWQHTQSASLPGIDHAVDMNVFNGEDLNRLLLPQK